MVLHENRIIVYIRLFWRTYDEQLSALVMEMCTFTHFLGAKSSSTI